jgi:MraZ protein
LKRYLLWLWAASIVLANSNTAEGLSKPQYFFAFFLTDGDSIPIFGSQWGFRVIYGENEGLMASYTGRYTISVDGKGRIAVPKRLRDAASVRGSAHFVLNRGMDGCLELYSETDWKDVEERLTAQHPIEAADSRFFKRNFYSHVVPAPADPQGRIVIPSFLLESAGIEKEVLILGIGDKVELWNEARYNAYLLKFGETPETVAERLFSKIDR